MKYIILSVLLLIAGIGVLLLLARKDIEEGKKSGGEIK